MHCIIEIKSKLDLSKTGTQNLMHTKLSHIVMQTICFEFFQGESIIIYDVGGTRFCGNVGREHKSNNIRY